MGIHKGGIEEEQINIGRIMTPDLIATLEAEASRMGAVSFLVDSQPASNPQPQPAVKSPPVKPVSNNNPNTNSQGHKKKEELKVKIPKK